MDAIKLDVETAYPCTSVWLRKTGRTFDSAITRDDIEVLLARINTLEDTLETEQLRLAACGVCADANTPDSIAIARNVAEKYMSGSLQSVFKAVDREIKHRNDLELAQAQITALRDRLQQLIPVCLNALSKREGQHSSDDSSVVSSAEQVLEETRPVPDTGDLT